MDRPTLLEQFFRRELQLQLRQVRLCRFSVLNHKYGRLDCVDRNSLKSKHHEQDLINALGSAAAAGSSFLAAAAKATQGAQATISGINVSTI